jgi:hypothetical protein
LEKRGVCSPNGNSAWSRQAISKLLSNEKYAGYSLLQKTVAENGRQLRNDGQSDRYLYCDNNPAIISTGMFKAVQLEKQRRSKFSKNDSVHEWLMSL